MRAGRQDLLTYYQRLVALAARLHADGVDRAHIYLQASVDHDVLAYLVDEAELERSDEILNLLKWYEALKRSAVN